MNRGDRFRMRVILLQRGPIEAYLRALAVEDALRGTTDAKPTTLADDWRRHHATLRCQPEPSVAETA